MSRLKSVDHTTMREMNLSLILNTLRVHAPISRAGLSGVTQLNKTTVSSLVRELLDSELIREIGVDPTVTDIGRPAINLEVNPGVGTIIGADIGVDYISVIAANFAVEIVARRYENTSELTTSQEILDRAVAVIHEVYQEVTATSLGQPVFGIGLGLPVLVDSATGTLLFAPNLSLHDIAVRELMEKEFSIPVYVDNEANLAALGETYFGAGRESNYVLYVVSSVGLGGGIVIDGRLMTGAAGFAGEFGHMTLDPAGLRCSCGNFGCFETLVSQRALYRRIRSAVGTGKPSLLVEATEGDLNRLTVPMIVEAAEEGDVVARTALEETGNWLGIGIASLINALNPERVVFGGTLSIAHEYLLPVVKEVVAKRALRWSNETAEIVIAEHGPDASVIGGIAAIYRQILSNPTSWIH
ncbi:MAG: ROK family protein [Chloroflexota bacterium]